MKKFKKIMIIIYVLIAISFIGIIVFGKDSNEILRSKVKTRNNEGLIVTDERIFDEADILTETEEKSLKEYMNKVSKEKQVDIVIVTTNDAEGKQPREYAEDFYKSHDFGYEDFDGTGLLYLISLDKSVTGNRELWITTAKDAKDYFSESRIDSVLDNIYNTLTEDSELNYYGSCNEFIKGIETYMNVSDSVPIFLTKWYFKWGFSLVVTLIIFSIFIFNFGGKKTTTPETYLNVNSIKRNSRSDIFTHKNVTKTKIEKSSSSSSGSSSSGGGSSYGGGGRSF